MPVIDKPCSGCMEEFRLVIVTDGSGRDATESLRSAVVKMTVPSNGRRGNAFVPAHEVQTEATLDSDGVLLQWDCPRCGYADSEYADSDTRTALGS